MDQNCTITIENKRKYCGKSADCKLIGSIKIVGINHPNHLQAIIIVIICLHQLDARKKKERMEKIGFFKPFLRLNKIVVKLS